MNWQETEIGDFLYERKETFDPNDPNLLNYKKIEKIDFANGQIFLTKYSPTKTKQIITKNGDFVFSGLNIEKGAVTINDTGEDLVVSANYSTCEINYSKIEQKFFQYFIKSASFKKLLQENLKKDYGFTRPKHLLSLKISLPNIDIQKKIVKYLENVENEIKDLNKEVAYQKILLQKFRQSILHEAIVGKLTEQWRKENPEIQSASKLLKKIRDEKDQLILINKFKKQKVSQILREDEIPFIIPVSWQWCRLDDICFSISSGSTPSQDSFIEKNGVPYLKVYNIKNQKIDFYFKPQFVKEEINNTTLKRSILNPGDVVMNIVGPPLGKIAIIPDTFEQWNCNQAIVHFKLVQQSINKYLYYFLREFSFLNAIDFKGMAGQDNISVTQSRSIVFPLPPMEEQVVIVAKIENLFAMCDELEQQINDSKVNAKMLMQTVLKEAFEK